VRAFAGLSLAIAIVFALSFLAGMALQKKEMAALPLMRQKYVSGMSVKGALLDAVRYGAQEGEAGYAKKSAAGIEANLEAEVGDAAFASAIEASKSMQSLNGWEMRFWCGLPEKYTGRGCENCRPIEDRGCRSAFIADPLGRKVMVGTSAVVIGFDMRGEAGSAFAYIPAGTEVGY
jgi:hypothetical protein